MDGDRIGRMLDATEVIQALEEYRRKLKDRGHAMKAAAVAHCITIIKRLAK